MDEVVRCFGLNYRSVSSFIVKDLIVIVVKDKKNRFEFLGIREGYKFEEKGVVLWFLKMRVVVG